MRTHILPLIALLVLQAVCAFFFVGDILLSVLGIPFIPLDWALIELIEIGAALGLSFGVVLGAWALNQARRRTRIAEEALQAASGAFMDLVAQRFDEWKLTPAERDVALFALKGLSLQEIAALRQTSEGTVKAQTNAIYRKAGVSSRSQLISLFVEDLMGEALVERKPV
ncbi:MAG: LuxR C-terminal-related transcriptional regulator [Dinoroseobacter sp.]|nr:LuxR C-terminal-related transcriptional regulator [Dinoroseobacter sp.]MDJ0995531.1 LuxR C-terminal-related transcriptional regulator [Dinoroseobacter sp.]